MQAGLDDLYTCTQCDPTPFFYICRTYYHFYHPNIAEQCKQLVKMYGSDMLIYEILMTNPATLTRSVVVPIPSDIYHSKLDYNLQGWHPAPDKLIRRLCIEIEKATPDVTSGRRFSHIAGNLLHIDDAQPISKKTKHYTRLLKRFFSNTKYMPLAMDRAQKGLPGFYDEDDIVAGLYIHARIILSNMAEKRFRIITEYIGYLVKDFILCWRMEDEPFTAAECLLFLNDNGIIDISPDILHSVLTCAGTCPSTIEKCIDVLFYMEPGIDSTRVIESYLDSII